MKTWSKLPNSATVTSINTRMGKYFPSMRWDLSTLSILKPPYHPPSGNKRSTKGMPVNTQAVPAPPEEVSLLVRARQEARRTNNWILADDLRQQIYNLGWEITDTETGPLTNKLP